MATDIKKFLDQGGVSTLWSRIAEEVAKVDRKAEKNAEDIVSHGQRLDAAELAIEALEAGTYDDSELRGLIGDNATAIGANTAAIAVLNGDGEGSVSKVATAVAVAEVAKVVAGADVKFDTLKEIADWIANDTTGSAEMANDIAALEALVGDKAVATQIAEAIAAEGLDKYALAADLNALVDRVKALEDAGYMNEVAVNAAIDSKIAALKLSESYDAKGAAATAETNAKAYADSLAKNYDAAGSAATAETNAKAYADTLVANCDVKGAAAAAQAAAEAHSDANLLSAKAYSDANLLTAKGYTDTAFANIQALTEAEIDEAIGAAVLPTAEEGKF